MLRILFSALVLASSAPGLARAAALTVAPIRIDVAAPGNSATITLTNADARPVNVEVRLLAWSLVAGNDDYQDSDDVVATPPFATIEPNGAITVRIVRTSARPVVGEEFYRLVVDEIPDADRVRNIGVNIALRYTVPVFFLNPEATPPKLQWSAANRNGQRLLIATNTGDKHVRVSAMKVGAYVLFKGLAGYVLGHSTKTWALPAPAASDRITADSDGPPINAKIAR